MLCSRRTQHCHFHHFRRLYPTVAMVTYSVLMRSDFGLTTFLSTWHVTLKGLKTDWCVSFTEHLCLINRKHVPFFYPWLVMETRVEVWKNKKCSWNTSRPASVSTAFSSKLLGVFLHLHRNMKKMFSIPFTTIPRQKKLVYFDEQNVNSLVLAVITSTACSIALSGPNKFWYKSTSVLSRLPFSDWLMLLTMYSLIDSE